MDLWQLPTQALLGGEAYPHKSDYRVMLKLLALLGDQRRPAFYRWYVALEAFYERPIPRHLEAEAMAYLSDFLTCDDPGKPGPKLLDWRQDASAIISDINAVAGREIRSESCLHWWTFLSYFHSIREGRLSTVVAIRSKLLRGRKLEPHEQEYYLRNKAAIDLRPPETDEDRAEKARLEAMLRNA